LGGTVNPSSGAVTDDAGQQRDEDQNAYRDDGDACHAVEQFGSGIAAIR